MTRVHIDGASGYAAGEFIRLAAHHPVVQIGAVASESSAGATLGELFPSLAPLRKTFVDRETLGAHLVAGDTVLHAGEALEASLRIPQYLRRGVRVIDLSAAFRLKSVAAYDRWYGFSHEDPALVQQAAYGLPELYATDIASARLVANPGCYPTAVLLSLAPIIRAYGTKVGRILVDAKSGVSGAGRKSKSPSLYSEVASNVRPYAVNGHRHHPEIAEQLSALGCDAPFVFLPHVVPLSRGLLASCYLSWTCASPRSQELYDVLASAYAHCPLVTVLAADTLPETRAVIYTARALIGAARLGNDVAVIVCAIDNLGKGAAAQALQNLNIMHGLPQETGLDALAGVA